MDKEYFNYLKLTKIDDLIEENKEENEMCKENVDKSLLDDDWNDALMKIDVESSSSNRNECVKMNKDYVKMTKGRINLIAKIEKINFEKGDLIDKQLADVFYQIVAWPTYVIRVLLNEGFKRQDRLALASFFDGNGFNDKKFCSALIKFCNPHFKLNQEWKRRIFEFEDLFKYLDDIAKKGEKSCFYYYYCMPTKHMIFYTGNLKKNDDCITYTSFGRYK